MKNVVQDRLWLTFVVVVIVYSIVGIIKTPDIPSRGYYSLLGVYYGWQAYRCRDVFTEWIG